MAAARKEEGLCPEAEGIVLLPSQAIVVLLPPQAIIVLLPPQAIIVLPPPQAIITSTRSAVHMSLSLPSSRTSALPNEKHRHGVEELFMPFSAFFPKLD